MPAIVVAGIISAGAGIGATVYSSRAAGSNQKKAAAAENAALDKSLAHQTAATDKAIVHETALDKTRHDEWQREQDDARAQHEWYQQALEPYRQASRGALGSLGDLVARLGGGDGLLAGIAPDMFSQATKTPDDGTRTVGGPKEGVSGPWAPSDLVRTGAPARGRVPTSAAMSRTLASGRPGVFTGGAGAGGDQAVPAEIINAAATIADLVRNLPPSARAPGMTINDPYGS